MSDKIPVLGIIARREVKLRFDFVIPKETYDPNTDYNKIADEYIDELMRPFDGTRWDTKLFPIHVDCTAELITD